MDKKMKKGVIFDLSKQKLMKHYPQTENFTEEQVYVKACKDICEVMEAHSFTQLEELIFVSNDIMDDSDINNLVEEIVKTFKWFYLSMDNAEVLNLGETHILTLSDFCHLHKNIDDMIKFE